MKVAFPVTEAKGLDSIVFNHFGSAPHFVLVELETGEWETLANQDLNHTHGNCQPMKALGGVRVDGIVVGGIGMGALGKLKAEGVKVFRALEGTVTENLAVVKDGKLSEYLPIHTCKGHTGIGGCHH